jgi:predicted Na+-dependent transporter
LFILAVIAVGFTHKGVGDALAPLTSLLLAMQMFLLGTSVRFTQVWDAVRQPRYLALWALLAWGLSPALSFGLGKVFLRHQAEFAAGLILTTSLPAAVTASVWTGISQGNLPLALTIVGAASVLSGIVTPLLLSAWVGVLVELDTAGLLRGLFGTVMLPTLLGVAVNELCYQRLDPYRPAARFLTKLLIGLVMFVNAAALRPHLVSWGWNAALIVALVLFQAIALYVLVFWLVRLMPRVSAADAVALTYATAMRNNSAGIVIGLTYFGPTVAAPVVLSILIQQPLASVVHRCLFAPKSGSVPAGGGNQPSAAS